MEWKNDIDENVRSGIVELLMLHLLCERDMYGYEIIKLLAKRTNDAFIMKQTSLYGPLYRMSSRSLISSHKEMAGKKDSECITILKIRDESIWIMEKNGSILFFQVL